MTTALKYGLVGAGFVAKFHLAALRQLRGMEVAGVTALKGGAGACGDGQGMGRRSDGRLREHR
jgi:predicted dehydrogenase